MIAIAAIHFVVVDHAAFADEAAAESESRRRPNILVAISDDQSFPHASAYGYAAITTPAFDRIAKNGVLFRNAFTPAPGCSPMRAAFLTGRNIWQIENAGTHASSFPSKYDVYPNRLESAGYFVGFTGKGWGPGNWKASARSRNPAGVEYSRLTMDAPEGIRRTDYAANFADFLKERPEGQPFSFWYGGSEPHRKFKKGIGEANGIDPAKVVVPPFLPDTPEVRSDISDYCFEIQWFDRHLGRMLDLLESEGELENTIVIVTSDNGMAFPRAKANVYEYGIHMPLAISWPAAIPANQVCDKLVNLIDVTASIYDMSGVDPPEQFPPAGKSLSSLLKVKETFVTSAPDQEPDQALDQEPDQGDRPEFDSIFSGRERHSSSRYQSLGYPQRCIRTADYLYIRNFRPERWPAGAPQKYGRGKTRRADASLFVSLGPLHDGYHDIDDCPTLSFLIEGRETIGVKRFFHWAVDHRPAEELFAIKDDPGCLRNLADSPDHQDTKRNLSARLRAYLQQTGDPRAAESDDDIRAGDVFESYPRYSGLRWFPTPSWAEQNPQRVPNQRWVLDKDPL